MPVLARIHIPNTIHRSRHDDSSSWHNVHGLPYLGNSPTTAISILLCLARSRSRLLHLSRLVSPSARRLRSTTPRENIRRIIRFSNRNSSILMVLRLPFHCFPLKHYTRYQKRNHLHQVNLEAEAQGNPFKFSDRKRGRAKSSSPPSQGLAILFSFHPTSQIPPSSPHNAVIEQRCGVSSCISAEHRMLTNTDMLAVNSSS